MNHKSKIINNEAACEKYLNRMLRQENLFSTKKSPAPKLYHEKFSHIIKPSVVQPTRPKAKNNIRQPTTIQRSTTQHMSPPQKDQGEGNNKEYSKSKSRHRSSSECRAENKDREAWGQLLQNQKSREKVSSFSNFDPLRTLHFLSKELHTKLEHTLPDDDILQMVSDIQHALKRIPPEISTLLRSPQNEYPQLENSVCAMKQTANKICQTPPTLYKEDTEKFQKIMEENTFRLEASCKQLEMVCTNLQREKEITEAELEEARDNMEMLCRRIKDLEYQLEEMSITKIKQLQEEKQQLQEELDKAIREINDNPTLNHLKKIVDELKKQKTLSDETCARLEYDMTLLKMEKEKFVTMLAVRDREVKDIQKEMSKIQEQVNKQLTKLNSEVASRCSSMKILHDNGINENLFLDIGDTTISSITTNGSDKETINVIKESPCGDAELVKELQGDIINKLKATNVETDLPVSKDQDVSFEDLLQGLTPSMKALISSHNL